MIAEKGVAVGTKWYRFGSIAGALFLTAVVGACANDDDMPSPATDGQVAAPATPSPPAPTTTESEADTSAACARASVALTNGRVADASKLTAGRETNETCERVIDAIENRNAATTAALEACEKSVEAANDASTDDHGGLVEAALRDCATAARLDVDAEVAPILVTLDTDGDSDTATDQLESWWSELWDPLKSIAERVAQGLLLLLFLTPLVNYLGTLVGRSGRTHLRKSRAALRQSPSLRRFIAGLAGLALAGILTGPGKLQWWGATALGAGVLSVVAVLLISVPPGGRREQWSRGLGIPVAAVLGGVIGGLFLRFHIDDVTTRSVLAAVVSVVLVLVISWVLAQRANLRFDDFAKEDGTTGSSFGQLVASEVFRLNATKAVQVDIVDAATTATVETSSLTAMAGTPENKLIGALVGVVRTVFVPGTDYRIGGQLIASGKNGAGVSVQLKYNRRMVAGDSLFSERTGVDGAESSDAATGPAHNDLVGMVATWVIIELQREISGDDTDYLRRTFGCADAGSLISLHVASQAMAAGDLMGARAAYAEALDLDFSNGAARLGLAVVLARSLGKDASEADRRSAFEALATTAREVYGDALTALGENSEPNVVELSARYGELAAIANKHGLIGTGPASFGQPLVDFKNRIERLDDEDRRKEPMLALYHSLCVTALSDDDIDEAIEGSESANARNAALSIKEARSSLRGRYNLAARYCHSSNMRHARLEEIKTYLREAASLPMMARFAATDPYFDDVVAEPWFRSIVPAGAPPESELARVHTIGKHFAARLADHEIFTFDDLRLLDFAASQELASELGVSISVVRGWRKVGEIESIDGIGPVYVNLLLLCGITSRSELARQTSRSLHDMTQAVGSAHEVGQRPSLNDVRDWIEEARQD